MLCVMLYYSEVDQFDVIVIIIRLARLCNSASAW